MNRTTVKRGIGAVILALIAASLLAFLLKDKAAQRQEVVEIALPGSDSGIGTSDQTDRLPTLTTDNSGNGDVIANAGSGNGNATTGGSTGSANTSTQQSAATGNTGSGSATSGSNPDGTIIASAAAVGATAAGAATAAVSDSAKTMDFSVKPRAATSKASSEFLDLDLVNNGTKKVAAETTSTAAKASDAVANAAPTVTEAAAPAGNASNSEQGVVIASTSPRTVSSAPSGAQPRLIGEKKSAPIKSARTAKVIEKKAPAKAVAESAPTSNDAVQAKNGYAIQLLATSSSSRANNLKKVMSGEGYSTYVTQTKQNGKTLYRVRIGQYKTKSQATTVQTAMKRRYKKNTNVNRSAVVAR